MGKKRDVFEDVAKRQSAHAMNRVKVCHEFGGGSSLSLKTNRSVFLRLPLEQPRHWRRLLTVSSIKSSCSFFFYLGSVVTPCHRSTTAATIANSCRAAGGGAAHGGHPSSRGHFVRPRVPLLHRGTPSHGSQTPPGSSGVDEAAFGWRGQP